MSENSHAPAPSRRNVIRSAAWSLPAVTVVTAAPAFAATGDSLAITQFTGDLNPLITTSGVLVSNLGFTNTGNALPAGTITVSVTVPASWGDVTSLTGFVRNGWTFSFSGRTVTWSKAVTGLAAGASIDAADSVTSSGAANPFFYTSASPLSSSGHQVSATVTYTYAGQSVVASTSATTGAGGLW